MKRVILGVLLTICNLYGLEAGKIPTVITIDGKDGGDIKGDAWSSSILKNKISILFYVDPDESETNQLLYKALRAKNFSGEHYRSIAIINLAASWLPNIILEHKLKAKQRDFPNTIYIKDKNKILVERWGLKDDSSGVLIFNKSGKLIYQKFGKHNKKEITEVIDIMIKQNL